MIGSGLQRAARWLVRPQTYLLTVEPAIADLQFEARRSTVACVRAYVGVWRALAAAVAQDVTTETGQGLAALARPVPLRHGAYAFVSASLLLLFPIGSGPPDFGPSWWALLLFFPSTVPIAMLPALTLAVRAAAQQTRAMRGFLTIAALAAMLLFVGIDQGVTRTNQVFREASARAAGIQQVPRGARAMTVSELLAFSSAPQTIADRPVGLLRAHAMRRHFVREAHARIALSAVAFAYVLLGVALASVRLRRAWIVLIAFFAAHSQVLMLPRFVDPHGPVGAMVLAVWLAPATMTAIAALVLRRQSRARTPAATAR